MQIAVALIYVVSALMKEGKTINRIIYTIVGLILLAGIIQLSSKSVIAALFLTISVVLPIFSLQGARRIRFISVAASSAIIVFIILCNIRAFRDRYVTELKEDFSTARPNQRVESRILRWKLAVDLIKQKPIIGHSAGSEIPLLQDQYFAKKYYTSYLHRLNAHNEYMSFLIKSGIWGLAIYIIMLIYGFRLAARKKDVVFFGFMLLLAIVSLSENILDVDKGVMFYSFFFPFFVFIAEQEDKLVLPVKRHKNLRNVATNRMAATSIE
jgi:O-antigen ligase